MLVPQTAVFPARRTDLGVPPKSCGQRGIRGPRDLPGWPTLLWRCEIAGRLPNVRHPVRLALKRTLFASQNVLVRSLFLQAEKELNARYSASTFMFA